MKKLNHYLDSDFFPHFCYGIFAGAIIFAAHPLAIVLLAILLLINFLQGKLKKGGYKSV